MVVAPSFCLREVATQASRMSLFLLFTLLGWCHAIILELPDIGSRCITFDLDRHKTNNPI